MVRDRAYESAELAELYDAIHADRDDLGFWHAMADESHGARLLEIGCGTGRVLLPLARAGHRITGIDTAPAMLARCRSKLAGEPSSVRERAQLVTADATSFDLGDRFGLIIVPFGGFHHLRTADEQLRFLERCRRHLSPSGLLVLDLFNPDPSPIGCLSDEGQKDEASVAIAEWREGRRIRSWMTIVGYDRAQQCNDCRMICEILESDGSPGRRLSMPFVLRYVFRFELEHLLARCGFRLVALHGDYDRSPFSSESLAMIAVAAPGSALDT